ncbi:hypothetical protein DFH06DRAFT_1446385, partial [Mycena polygramma]
MPGRQPARIKSVTIRDKTRQTFPSIHLSLLYHNMAPATVLPARKSERSRRPADALTNPENGELTLAAMDALVDRIDTLSRALPNSVETAARDGHVHHVMSLEGHDGNAPSTFNRRMDLLFGEDLRDSSGRLQHVRRGKHGMALVVTYLKSIQWGDMLIDIATIKLERIIAELEFLCGPSSTKSKRTLDDAFSDVEEVPPPKRIRSTSKGTVTVEERDDDFEEEEEEPEDNDLGNESDNSRRAGPSEKPVPGPGGKSSHITKEADRRRAKRKASIPQPSSDPTAVDEDGMLVDVVVSSINVPAPVINATADVLHFGGAPYMTTGKSGVAKLHRKCRLCNKETVADPSTVRRHLESKHKEQYHKWATKHNFESKLSCDIKARADAVTAAAKEEEKAQLHQQSLDSHLRKKPDRVARYSDELMRDAALQWLIATDQPIDALTNPEFKKMIDIAARATEGVTLPNRAQTREGIINLFHEQMNQLKIRLHVRL